jgi:hypothetical protein
MKDFVKEEDRRRGRARWGILCRCGDGGAKLQLVSDKFTALAAAEGEEWGLREGEGGESVRSGIRPQRRRRRRRRRRGIGRPASAWGEEGRGEGGMRRGCVACFCCADPA